MVQFLNLTIFSISILTLVMIHPHLAVRKWSCAESESGFKYDLDMIFGTWYEVARSPPSVVPACVSVEASNVVENEIYNLRVNYINNIDKQWKPTTENLSFPWNEDTKNGIFKITYGKGWNSITLIFKLMVTNYDSLALICYYTKPLPYLSMAKVMTRNRSVDASFKEKIINSAKAFGVSASNITWVEQSSKCENNAKMNFPASYSMLIYLLDVCLYFMG